MDANKIQHAYLRAMYTETPQEPASGEEAFVMAHFLNERLEVERAARVRNLRTVLHDDMRLLRRVIDKSELLPYVQAYAKSEWFWTHRGRTLIEDFCLFFVECSAASAVFKLLARIEGVCSGLSASTADASPWTTHLKVCDGEETRESFAAPFALSFNKVLGKKTDYLPVERKVDCVVRRSGEKIHVKFFNA